MIRCAVNRKWLCWTATLLAILTVVPCEHYGRRDMALAADPGDSRKMIECVVTLGVVAAEGNLKFVITDPKTIERLIEKPLLNAKKDPRPLPYPCAGNIQCRYSDGTSVTVGIFQPWGHCKMNSKNVF